jgi:hypothetical protein
VQYVGSKGRWYEVRAAGLSAVQQYGAKVHYKDIVVGEYFVDLLVNNVLLVELKTVKALDDAHRMQCTNYLKATGLDSACCLILASRAWRSNAWPMVYEEHRVIGVFCVHRLPESALRFFLGLRRRKAGRNHCDEVLRACAGQ